MASLPLPSYPQINGARTDFSCITFKPNGVPIAGITEINYSQELKGGEVRGTPIQTIGYTPGQLKCKADFTILQLEWNLMVPALAVLGSGTPLSGYMQARFDLIVQYQLPQSPFVITDIIRGCKIASHDQANKLGTDALAVKVELEPFFILLNGVAPVVYGPGGMTPG